MRARRYQNRDGRSRIGCPQLRDALSDSGSFSRMIVPREQTELNRLPGAGSKAMLNRTLLAQIGSRHARPGALPGGIARLRYARQTRQTRRKSNRARAQIVRRRKQPAERRVGPFDQARHGAEVPRKLQRFQPHITDPRIPSSQEQSHLRFAELVDGLHRVANNKEGSPIAGLPAHRECLDQVELGQRSVLEFIDQDMPQ